MSSSASLKRALVWANLVELELLRLDGLPWYALLERRAARRRIVRHRGEAMFALFQARRELDAER